MLKGWERSQCGVLLYQIVSDSTGWRAGGNTFSVILLRVGQSKGQQILLQSTLIF